MKHFFSFHPLVVFSIFISVLLMVFLSHPLFHVGVLLGGGFLYLTVAGGRSFLKSLTMTIPLFLLLTITNPLFSHNGKTVLFYLFDNRITLESMLYGVDLGCMILGVTYWSMSYTKSIKSEVFISLFGAISPKIGLIVSMTIRFVPLFIQKAKEIHLVQKAQVQPQYGIDKLKSSLSVFSITVTWALENAVKVSQSMYARGYGVGKRSFYRRVTFTVLDGVWLAVIWVLMGFLLFLFGSGVFYFSFYPAITSNSIPIISGMGYGIAFFLNLMPGMMILMHKLSVWQSIQAIPRSNERSKEWHF